MQNTPPPLNTDEIKADVEEFFKTKLPEFMKANGIINYAIVSDITPIIKNESISGMLGSSNIMGLDIRRIIKLQSVLKELHDKIESELKKQITQELSEEMFDFLFKK